MDYLSPTMCGDSVGAASPGMLFPVSRPPCVRRRRTFHSHFNGPRGLIGTVRQDREQGRSLRFQQPFCSDQANLTGVLIFCAVGRLLRTCRIPKFDSIKDTRSSQTRHQFTRLIKWDDVRENSVSDPMFPYFKHERCHMWDSY